jgi:hypothetical protein
MKWHYRTIRHIDSRWPDTEPYETAHEFSYDPDAITPEYDGFCPSPCHAMSKEEAQWILDAYNHPPAIEVDDADHLKDEYGFDDYTKYKWLDKRVPEKEQKV